jgi:endonuclease III
MSGFWKIVERLEDHYGPPSAPISSDPFELILYENIAYLVSDDRREKAFRELKKRVGVRPADVLTAPVEELAEITAMGGIFPDLRARRLQESARMVRDQFGGNLRRVLALDPVQARKALRKFPVVGEPGADKILLFTGTVPSLAPESNGLRALVRLGFVQEHKNYSTMYRAAQTALQDECGEDCAPQRSFEKMIVAHQLLKRHGQELCRRSAPRCEACPLRKTCPSASA